MGLDYGWHSFLQSCFSTVQNLPANKPVVIKTILNTMQK